MALGMQSNRVILNEPKIVHVNKALFCFQQSAPLDELAKQGEGLYGAIVCRIDQMPITREFCAALALVGVVRVAFLCPVLARVWLAGIA